MELNKGILYDSGGRLYDYCFSCQGGAIYPNSGWDLGRISDKRTNSKLFLDLKVIVHHYADKVRRAEKYEIEELRHELFITKRTLEEAEFRSAIAKGEPDGLK